MSDDTHQCPGPACVRRIPPHLLACGRHWGQVSRDTQRAVYATWQGGTGAGTLGHLRAMNRAIAEMKP